MKKIIFSIITSVIIFSSCSDILEEEPLSNISANGYYENVENLNSTVITIYSPIVGNFAQGGQFFLLNNAREDHATGKGIYANVAAYQGYPANVTAQTDAAWGRFYAAIRLANTIIKYGPEAKGDEVEKSVLIGEAYFLRAFSYFQLVKNWGPVPIKTEPTEDLSNVNVKLSPVNDVYDLIVEDLKIAEEKLPDTRTQSGRATKGLAKTTLADVYLNQEKWELARDKAEEVINSGIYSLVRVTKASDFEAIFGPEVVTHSEDIFSLKFTRQNGTWFPQFFHQPDNIWSSRGFGTFWGLPNKYPLLKNWDKNDLRYQFDVYSSYTTSDGAIKQNPNGWVMFGKYKDAGFNPSHGNNIPLYRYPEVLLIYAEAAAEAATAPTALALERLNMVHRRAYGYDPEQVSPVDFLLPGQTLTTFKNLVLQERAYEFICEGKRWFDLLRTGTLKDVIFEAKGIVVSDEHLYFPVPVQEVNTNTEVNP